MALKYNDPLLSYDDPIANYNGSLVMAEYYLRLLAAVEARPTLAEISAAVIPVNLVQVKGQTVNGTGSAIDPWGP